MSIAEEHPKEKKVKYNEKMHLFYTLAYLEPRTYLPFLRLISPIDRKLDFCVNPILRPARCALSVFFTEASDLNGDSLTLRDDNANGFDRIAPPLFFLWCLRVLRPPCCGHPIV